MVSIFFLRSVVVFGASQTPFSAESDAAVFFSFPFLNGPSF